MIFDYFEKDKILGVTALDLDLGTIEKNLYPLRNVTNMEQIYLVNSADQAIIYSMVQTIDPKKFTLSNHLFNHYKDESDDLKSDEQIAFERDFEPLFNQRTEQTLQMYFIIDGVKKEMLI